MVGPGPGSAQPIKRFAFQGGSLVDIGVPQANPFPGFTGGMTVAAGEGAMAVGMATGGGTVAVYDGANLSRTRTLSPFGASWTGGVTVAVYGDFLAVGKNSGNADVNVYRMSDLSLVTTVHPQASGPQAGYAGGTRVSWTLNAAGNWELLTGTGPGWSALVQYYGTTNWNVTLSYPDFSGYPGGFYIA